MYSRADIDTIREKVDIVKFLEDRGTTFRKTGVSFQALCPIHSERSPSFSVRPIDNTFHCFGCGRGGDIITLVQEIDSLSFSGAIQELAEYAEIELESVDEDPDYKKKQRLYKICQTAADWFREQFLALPDTHPAKKNLAERNLLYPNNEAGYGGLVDPIIGYAPAKGLLDVLFKERYSLDEIIEAGLAKQGENGTRETFRNRLLWTIQDPSGRPTGFSGRKVAPEDIANDRVPKYLNSPETPLYKKSGALLGLAWAKKEIAKSQRAYVVEGQTDVMALRAIGIDNVVASCGTAFGTEHAHILSRLAATGRDAERFQIVFCFDGDAAGVKAAKTVFEKNPNIHLNSLVARLEKYDPCDMRLKEGDDALRGALADSISLTEFILLEELKTWDVRSPEGKIAFLGQAKQILAQITNTIQRDAYIRKIALWTGLPVDEVRPMLATGQAQPQPVATPNQQAEAVTLESKLLAFALQYQDVFRETADKAHLSPDMFPTEQALAASILAGDPIDLGDPRTVSLLHIDLQVDEARAAKVLRGMIVSYYRLLYTQEIKAANMLLSSASDGDAAADESLFMRVLDEQERIKQKYAINF